MSKSKLDKLYLVSPATYNKLLREPKKSAKTKPNLNINYYDILKRLQSKQLMKKRSKRGNNNFLPLLLSALHGNKGAMSSISTQTSPPILSTDSSTQTALDDPETDALIEFQKEGSPKEKGFTKDLSESTMKFLHGLNSEALAHSTPKALKLQSNTGKFKRSVTDSTPKPMDLDSILELATTDLTDQEKSMAVRKFFASKVPRPLRKTHGQITPLHNMAVKIRKMDTGLEKIPSPFYKQLQVSAKKPRVAKLNAAEKMAKYRKGKQKLEKSWKNT